MNKTLPLRRSAHVPNALARVRARWFYKGMCSCLEASDLSDLDGMRDKVKKKVEIDFSGKNVPKKEMGSKPKEAMECERNAASDERDIGVQNEEEKGEEEAVAKVPNSDRSENESLQDLLHVFGAPTDSDDEQNDEDGVDERAQMTSCQDAPMLPTSERYFASSESGSQQQGDTSTLVQIRMLEHEERSDKKDKKKHYSYTARARCTVELGDEDQGKNHEPKENFVADIVYEFAGGVTTGEKSLRNEYDTTAELRGTHCVEGPMPLTFDARREDTSVNSRICALTAPFGNTEGLSEGQCKLPRDHCAQDLRHEDEEDPDCAWNQEDMKTWAQ